MQIGAQMRRTVITFETYFEHPKLKTKMKIEIKCYIVFSSCIKFQHCNAN